MVEPFSFNTVSLGVTQSEMKKGSESDEKMDTGSWYWCTCS